MTAIVAVAICLMLISGRRGLFLMALVVGVSMLFGALATAALVAVGVLGVMWRRARIKSAQARQSGLATSLVVEVVALAVSAGLPFSVAADLGARTAGGDVAVTIERALRTVPGQPLRFEPGHESLRTMFGAAQRSAQTGASLGPMLVAIGSDLRNERATEARERLSRLPVKLLFPLSFLILPGFVLLAVAPAVVGGLSRLGI